MKVRWKTMCYFVSIVSDRSHFLPSLFSSVSNLFMGIPWLVCQIEICLRSTSRTKALLGFETRVKIGSSWCWPSACMRLQLSFAPIRPIIKRKCSVMCKESNWKYATVLAKNRFGEKKKVSVNLLIWLGFASKEGTGGNRRKRNVRLCVFGGGGVVYFILTYFQQFCL